MRRLTDRQVAVLAAIERLGSPTLPELRAQLPALPLNGIWRVIEALERRGLVTERGYGSVRFVAVARGSGAEVPGWISAGD